MIKESRCKSWKQQHNCCGRQDQLQKGNNASHSSNTDWNNDNTVKLHDTQSEHKVQVNVAPK